MAGLDKNTPLPTEIKLHQKSRVLEIALRKRPRIASRSPVSSRGPTANER